MPKPSPGSGKSQITKAGQTSSNRYASDPHVKVKGGDSTRDQSIKVKNL